MAWLIRFWLRLFFIRFFLQFEAVVFEFLLKPALRVEQTDFVDFKASQFTAVDVGIASEESAIVDVFLIFV